MDGGERAAVGIRCKIPEKDASFSILANYMQSSDTVIRDYMGAVLEFHARSRIPRALDFVAHLVWPKRERVAFLGFLGKRASSLAVVGKRVALVLMKCWIRI